MDLLTAGSAAKRASDVQHLTYRPDIDGLRAVAVLSVMMYHAFPATLSGGFVGVDIFFVISGFLISTIIFKGLEINGFSFSIFTPVEFAEYFLPWRCSAGDFHIGLVHPLPG